MSIAVKNIKCLTKFTLYFQYLAALFIGPRTITIDTTVGCHVFLRV